VRLTVSDEDVLRDSSVVSPVGHDALLEPSASAMGPEAAADLPVGPVALWFGALGSPIAWAVQLMLMYPLVELACRWQTSLPLYVTSGSLFGVALLAGLVSWRSVRAMARHNGATVPRRARFMGRFGLWSGVLFVILIAGGALPVVFDDPCQLPGRRPPTVLPHL
jgi:hypothetical protein